MVKLIIFRCICRFEKLIEYLREKSTISRTKDCLERFHRTCNLMHKVQKKDSPPEKVNVRIFLAMYMIVEYTAHVFESMGELEQKLLASAQKLLNIFEEIMQSTVPMHSLPRDLTKSFPPALFEYMRDFKGWKVPDEQKLLARIKDALCKMYVVKEYMSSDEPEDSKQNTDLRDNIFRLREKLRQIAGNAELALFDAENPCPYSSSGGGGGGGGGGGATGRRRASERMNNEQLAHELLLDPCFQLTDSGTSFETPSARNTLELFHQVYWRSLIHDFDMSPPCYVRGVLVLVEVRDGLVEVASPQEAMRAAELLDLDLIKQQLDAGTWSWGSWRELMGSVMGLIQRVQSPARDDETRTRWAALQVSMDDAPADERSAVVVGGLEFMLNRVNALRIDAANARLRLIAPVIRDHGVDYERGKLKEKLDAGDLTLERTKAWLVLDGVTSLEEVYLRAMISLITSETELCEAECPETLLMDVRRINEYKKTLDQITGTVALGYMISPSVGQEKTASITALLASNGNMREAVETVLGGDVTPAILIAVDQCSDKNNAVYVIMRRRVVAAMRSADFKDFRDYAVPLVQGLVKKVRVLIDLNRRVHGPTYEGVYASAAASGFAASDSGSAASGSGSAASGSGSAAAADTD